MGSLQRLMEVRAKRTLRGFGREQEIGISRQGKSDGREVTGNRDLEQGRRGICQVERAVGERRDVG